MEQQNVGIFIFDQVEVLDFAGPYEVFSRTRTVPGMESRLSGESAPFNVFTVARNGNPVAAVGGLKVVQDYGFKDAPGIDLLVIPGGMGTRALIDDDAVLAWIRRVAAGTAQTTSVCTGALLLAQAGLLEGRRATTHWGALDLLESLGRDVDVDRNSRVVDDGIVTSAGVSAGIDMAFHVVERFCGSDVANETAHYRTI
ncbi:MAG: DJ-1/PfpI family protein [Alphaproteobacteria bacterium]|nr:DJ-1/PfpI family protein [Alphaproteobacteria bacterium]